MVLRCFKLIQLLLVKSLFLHSSNHHHHHQCHHYYRPFDALSYRSAVTVTALRRRLIHKFRRLRTAVHDTFHNLIARLQKGTYEAAETETAACCNHRTFHNQIMFPADTHCIPRHNITCQLLHKCHNSEGRKTRSHPG